MYIVDAHSDTLLAMYEKKQQLKTNDLQISIDSLKETKMDYLQFFAVFESPSIMGKKAVSDVNTMIDMFNREAEENNITKILTKDDLDFKGIGGLLALEGMYFFEGNTDMTKLYEKGVRCMALTWNPDNEFAGGITGESNKGLTRAGKKLVRNAQDMGILIDVSHISDKGFWDMIEITKKPFIATHSNARAICSHRRNLDNDMIKALAKNNGVMGMNMFTLFLNDSGEANEYDVIKHIEHICSLVGPSHVGMGTDFDGIPRDKSAIDKPIEVTRILNRLLQLNYSEEDVAKIAGQNFLRVLKEVL